MCRHLFLFFFLFISFALIWFAVAVLLRALIISKFQALAGCCCCRGNGRRVKKFLCVIHVFGKCLLWDLPIYFIHKIMEENTKSGLWWNERIAEIKIKAEERKKTNANTHTLVRISTPKEQLKRNLAVCYVIDTGFSVCFLLGPFRSLFRSFCLILLHNILWFAQNCRDAKKFQSNGRWGEKRQKLQINRLMIWHEITMIFSCAKPIVGSTVLQFQNYSDRQWVRASEREKGEEEERQECRRKRERIRQTARKAQKYRENSAKWNAFDASYQRCCRKINVRCLHIAIQND